VVRQGWQQDEAAGPRRFGEEGVLWSTGSRAVAVLARHQAFVAAGYDSSSKAGVAEGGVSKAKQSLVALWALVRPCGGAWWPFQCIPPVFVDREGLFHWQWYVLSWVCLW
jgi:hypothetical protein